MQERDGSFIHSLHSNLQHGVGHVGNGDAQPSHGVVAAPPQGTTMPPGLALPQGLTPAANSTRHGATTGMGELALPRAEYTEAPRTFDDVFTLFMGTGNTGAGTGAHQPSMEYSTGPPSQPTAVQVGQRGSVQRPEDVPILQPVQVPLGEHSISDTCVASAGRCDLDE